MPTSITQNQIFDDLEKILFDEAIIQERVRALGNEISERYKECELTVIAIANGAIVFTADLIRTLALPIRLECIHVRSYGDQTTPDPSSEIVNTVSVNIKSRDVLLIDDILDTGNTLLKVSKMLRSMQPKSLKTCVLLDKKDRVVSWWTNFAGFQVPDDFVVGYGLDFAGRYRQLPYIGVLKKHLYT